MFEFKAGGDYHTHTKYSDGQFTPEEMILAAIGNGMTAIGISDHSYTSFDLRYCRKNERMAQYVAELHALKEKYKDQIEVYCGTEQDYYSDFPAFGTDYTIGSIHYVKFGDEYFPVDEGEVPLKKAAEIYCGGDIYKVAQEYFRTVGDVINKTGADAVGHFDVIAKYNIKEKMLDENDPRYVKAWQDAADRLLAAGRPFEINTAATKYGRPSAYPSMPILTYLKERGAKFFLSSDSHTCDGLIREFENYRDFIG